MDEFKDYVVKFLEEDTDKKTLLVRGYFEEDKLLQVLKSIRDSKKTNEVLFVLGDSSIKDVPDLFNGASVQKKFKYNTRLNTPYDFPNATGTFTKWRNHIHGTFGSRYDLSVFYPVFSVLFDPRDTEKFIRTVKNSLTDKNILITTSDNSDRAEKLYDIVDEVVVLDTKDESEKNQEQFRNIKHHLERHDLPFPY